MRSALIRTNVRPSPAVGTQTIASSAATMREGIAASPRKKLSECRVLVVEDDPNIAELMQLYLRKEAKSVDTARTASTALEMIRLAKYDIMLLDMILGGTKRGVDIEKEAKKDSPSTIFVFVTGMPQHDFSLLFPSERYPEIVLLKPVQKEELLSLLHQLVEKS